MKSSYKEKIYLLKPHYYYYELILAQKNQATYFDEIVFPLISVPFNFNWEIFIDINKIWVYFR